MLGTRSTPTFIYGDCDPAPCSPPLQVQHWTIERRPPSLYDAEIPCRRIRAGGVPAAAFESSGGVDVYVGDRTVVVFADSDAQAARAVAALRPVAGAATVLPPPAIDVEPALRRCAD